MPESCTTAARLRLLRSTRVMSRLLLGVGLFGASACRSEALETAAPGGAAPSQGGEAGATGTWEAGAAAGGAGAGSIVELNVLSRVRVSSDPDAEHHQQAFGDVDFGEFEVARATLSVTLESPCFPFSGWGEQDIPPGHRWPERCDAFDRALSVSLDDPDDASAPGATLGLELVRAVTPFGGPLHVEADVTDVVNGLPGAHRVRVKIDTWGDPEGQLSGAKGEWIASVSLSLEPGVAPRRVLAVLPLAYESQLQVEGSPIGFEAPAGASSARLEYRVTGHGAALDLRCIGPAEEFCRRTHELRLDGRLLRELTPWRDDCAELCTLTANDAELGPRRFCAENPCGAVESVQAPRANWCPGSPTAPFEIEAGALAVPGAHELTRRIPDLREGGSWLVSVSYFAFE